MYPITIKRLKEFLEDIPDNHLFFTFEDKGESALFSYDPDEEFESEDGPDIHFVTTVDEDNDPDNVFDYMIDEAMNMAFGYLFEEDDKD